MDPDLMGPPCEEFDSYELLPPISAGDQLLKGAPGLPPTGDDPHLHPVLRIPPYGPVDGEILLEGRLYDGQVVPPHTPLLQLFRQYPMGPVVLGHHHDPAGLLVQPMDDAVALLPADSGEGDPLPLEPIYEGRFFNAGGSVDHNSGRFVDDQNIVILIEFGDGEGRFCPRRSLDLGELHLYNGAGPHLSPPLFGLLSIYLDGPLFDELLHLVAGLPCLGGQKFIQSHGFVNGETHFSPL